MADSPRDCPKCSGKMKQGFVVDHSYTTRVVSKWAEGTPRKSFWTGTKLPDEKPVPIGTFRCSSCGYLESYAREEFAARG